MGVSTHQLAFFNFGFHPQYPGPSESCRDSEKERSSSFSTACETHGALHDPSPRHYEF